MSIKKTMMMSVVGLSLSALSVAGIAKDAIPDASRAEQRQENQKQAIDEAAASNKIDGKKEAELKKKQAGIEEEKEEAKNNGKVNKSEEEKLERMQDRQDKRIHDATKNK